MFKKSYNITKIIWQVLVLTSLTFISSFQLLANNSGQHINIDNIDNKRTIINLVGLNKVAPYSLILHEPAFSSVIKNKSSLDELNALITAMQDALYIKEINKASGVSIEAASFALNNDEMSSETHYDASWVRDSLWGYLALDIKSEEKRDANKILLTLWDYFSSPKQLERIRNVINHPEIINSANGQMVVPHIRYDNNSPDFDDVLINGKPQPWAHKQNDALGLFVDLVVRGITSGKISNSDWEKGKRLDALIGLVAYFDKVHFYDMPDSGMWEEDERMNTSSVGLVTSALENLYFINRNIKANKIFIDALNRCAKTLNMSHYIQQENLSKLVKLGYKRINYQLEKGGESPDYSPTDSRYRTADAALLGLIYPANLRQLTLKQKEKIIALVSSLEGSYGIRRYLKDSYQSANYWTIDYNRFIENNNPEPYKSFRDNNFIKGTEAQWFFDSWLARSYLQLFNETKNDYYYGNAVRSMNRALSQLTGKNMIGANGKAVPALSLPESYNIIYSNGQFIELPSPIVPLNWSKASITILFSEFHRILSSKNSAN